MQWDASLEGLRWESWLDKPVLLAVMLVVMGIVLLLVGRSRNVSARHIDQHVSALMSSSDRSFYYCSLKHHHEWFSRKLRDLFSLPLGAKFEDLLAKLPEAAAEDLREQYQQLIRERQAQFVLEIFLPETAQRLECEGAFLRVRGEPHIVLWWQDITARYKETHRLKKENLRVKQELVQLSNMINALPMPIWQRDSDLSIRFCNLAYLEAVEEIPDSSQPEMMEMYDGARKLASRALKTGKPMQEARHMILKGERKLYRFEELPWEDRRNLTGVGLDKTDVEKLQDRLQDTLRLQSDLLESITSAISIFGTDQRLKFYNNAFAQFWHLEDVWLDQEPRYGDVLEKLRENRVLPEQSNFPEFKKRHLKVFTNLIEPTEEFFYLPDGRTLRRLAIPDSAGGVLFADEDVTDRLALERSYNTLIAVQRETLNHLSDGVAVFGQDGRLTLCNPSYVEMWGLDRKIVESFPHLRDLLSHQKPFFYHDDWEIFCQQYLGLLSVQSNQELRLECTNGKTIELIAVPLPDGQKLFNYLDLTDSTLVEKSLRERNEALQEADRLKSEFLANVSYELRSPLTSISGYYEMLTQAYAGDFTPKQSEYLHNIGQASDHLRRLIDDILDIASIEAGYLKLDVESFDVTNMLIAVKAMQRERAEREGVNVIVECDAKLGSIEGDQNRLRQVMFNLLGNAIKFSPAKSDVLITAKAKGKRHIAITVADKGIGVPEEEQELIFTKFYRSANAARMRSGTGLGLAVVKSLIELHHGSIHLESEEGKGSKMTCIIPRIYVKAESNPSEGDAA